MLKKILSFAYSRYDLRPAEAIKTDSHATDGEATLPPPLFIVIEGEDGASNSQAQPRIVIDTDRLRQATQVQERIAALREIRAHGIDQQSEARQVQALAPVIEQTRQTGLAAKLKDRFRIRTRPAR